MLKWLTSWLSRCPEDTLFEAAIKVEFSEDFVTATYPDGSTQTAMWEGLRRVEIHTNDTGPWGADFWWVLQGTDGFCEFPQGATGELELVPRLQSLPGFDYEQFAEAIRCTDNRVFLCWQRE